MIAHLIGGVGLFLLGMTLLTDGLKALAGDALRRALVRFAGGPTSAVVSGAALTALVQSSSATTLATIGFVSAGLLTLEQAIGVVLGANLGTTSTAWLVSLVGLKFSVSTLALPLVGLGALGRVLARDRVAQAGTALAGFGLVFIGIDTLQAGMASLAAQIDPGTLPGATAGGRVVLVLVGAVMTVLMQSSSAAVATTLAGVQSGTIALDQAAALVIGQNVGTTVTAAIAAIGATVPARRTALAHILFNGLTGVVALALLPAFVALVVNATDDVHDPAVTLALFHTVFNLLGVLIFLPLTRQLGSMAKRLVPEQGPTLTRYLDPTVTRVPAVALEAARRTLVDVTSSLLRVAAPILGSAPAPRQAARELQAAEEALAETRRFLAGLRTETESVDAHARHLAVLHASDHLQRAVSTCASLLVPRHLGEASEIFASSEALSLVFEEAAASLQDPVAPGATGALQEAALHMAQRRRELRGLTLETTARGELDPDTAAARLERMQQLEWFAYSVWRAFVHLGSAPDRVDASSPVAAAPVPEVVP